MARSASLFTTVEPGSKNGWLSFLRARGVQPTTGRPNALHNVGIRQFSDEHGGRVDWLAWDQVETHVQAWRSLAARAVQPNVFLEPAFVLTAIRHEPVVRRPSFLLVWDADDATRLIGLFPIRLPLRPQDAIATCWQHEEATIGGALLDKMSGGAAIAAMLRWIAECEPQLCGLMFTAVPLDGFLETLFGQSAGRNGGIRIVEGSERNVLTGAAGGAVRPKAARATDEPMPRIDGSQRIRAKTNPEIRSALEDFLTLDAREATATGHALVDNPGQTTFARAMTRLMAREGMCQIEALVSAGRTIAAAILLRSGGTTYFWKLAFSRAAVAQAAIRGFVADILTDEAARGCKTIFSCDLPEAIDPRTTSLADMLVADVIVAPAGRLPREVTTALQREKRRRLASGIRQHLLRISAGGKRF
ncbi:MAG: family N-acetyltransferase [Hyphomicrobiales bacterium]|nr:family N-acetyltransferase [Hyphomicrobiales bacterium]